MPEASLDDFFEGVGLSEALLLDSDPTGPSSGRLAALAAGHRTAFLCGVEQKLREVYAPDAALIEDRVERLGRALGELPLCSSNLTAPTRPAGRSSRR